MDRNQHAFFKHSPRVVGQARKSLWIETLIPKLKEQRFQGQARKSLWIETKNESKTLHPKNGQARKSLWIETC